MKYIGVYSRICMTLRMEDVFYIVITLPFMATPHK